MLRHTYGRKALHLRNSPRRGAVQRPSSPIVQSHGTPSRRHRDGRIRLGQNFSSFCFAGIRLADSLSRWRVRHILCNTSEPEFRTSGTSRRYARVGCCKWNRIFQLKLGQQEEKELTVWGHKSIEVAGWIQPKCRRLRELGRKSWLILIRILFLREIFLMKEIKPKAEPVSAIPFSCPR